MHPKISCYSTTKSKALQVNFNMVCAKILVICSVLMLAFNLIECSKGVKNSKIDVVTVSSVEEFLKENNAKVLYPLTKESMIKGHSPYYYLSYGIGHRVDGTRNTFWFFCTLRLVITSKCIVSNSIWNIRSKYCRTICRWQTFSKLLGWSNVEWGKRCNSNREISEGGWRKRRNHNICSCRCWSGEISNQII